MGRGIDSLRVALGQALTVGTFTLMGVSTVFAQPAEPPARADADKTSSLSWTRLDGADSCIGTRDLASSVERMLGRTVFVSASQAELSVEGRVEPQPDGGFRAVISLSNAEGNPVGERELQTPESDCHKLDEPTALAIALMIDPNASPLGPPPPVPPPAPPPVPPPAPVPAPVIIVRDKPVYIPVPAPAPEPEEPWRWDGRGGAMLAVGMLPGPAVGLSASLTVEPPWFFPVESAFAVFVDQSKDGPNQSKAAFSLLYGAGSSCPIAIRDEIWTLFACGELAFGALGVTGTGFDIDGEETRLVAHLAARVRGHVRIAGPVTLGASLAAGAPLIRDRFQVTSPQGSTEIFRMSPVFVAPEVNLGLSLP